MTIEIKTQHELESQIAKGESDFRFVAGGTFEININTRWIKVAVAAELKYDVSVEARESSRVEAWGSSRVEARESSRVEAWGSSRVVARESSSVVARESSSVEAWGSSRVEAKGFVSLTAFGGTLKLGATCHVFVRSKKAKIKGGIKTQAILKTPKDWCEYYGVEVKNGVAILYKSVLSDFYNPYNRTVKYEPGTKPEATDWDGGKRECGGGLHFSPCVSMAREFHYSDNAKYVACPVALKDMSVHFDGSMPQKCKAKRVCKPLWEVNKDGEKI